MANRSDAAVIATIVNGVPVEKGEVADGFGTTLPAGTLLRAAS
ncbi:hypothetical protein [Nocardia brasiliensis]